MEQSRVGIAEARKDAITELVSNSSNQQFNWQQFPFPFFYYFFLLCYVSFNQSGLHCLSVKYVIMDKVATSSSAFKIAQKADASNCCGWPFYPLRIRNDNLPNALWVFRWPDWIAMIETYSQTNKVRYKND